MNIWRIRNKRLSYMLNQARYKETVVPHGQNSSPTFWDFKAWIKEILFFKNWNLSQSSKNVMANFQNNMHVLGTEVLLQGYFFLSTSCVTLDNLIKLSGSQLCCGWSSKSIKYIFYYNKMKQCKYLFNMFSVSFKIPLYGLHYCNIIYIIKLHELYELISQIS